MDYLKMSELYHDGTKGMKWGVRKYQYPDGTLTPAGKERYYGRYNYSNNGSDRTYKKWTYDSGVASNQLKDLKDTANNLNSMIPQSLKDKKAKKIYNEKYKDISTNELQERIRRISAEHTYSDLIGDTKIKENGFKVAGEILQSIGAMAGIALTAIMIKQKLGK